MPATAIAVMLLVPMVLAYGNDDELWGYAHRVFTLFGAASTIGIVDCLSKWMPKTPSLLTGGRIE